MILQLPLGIGLRDEATFENLIGGPNAEAVALARCAGHTGGEQFVYFWGAPGTGKTHLLQAVCHEIAKRGGACAYLPLHEHQDLAPEMLEGMEQLDVVCIDDVEQIAGDAAWELGLFSLYNALRDRMAGCMVIASAAPPGAWSWRLPDLASRLASCVVVHLDELAESDKLTALQLRARARGLELNDEVGQYLLRRCRRDMASLFALLEQLDRQSLVAQRRLTVPFVKEVMGT